MKCPYCGYFDLKVIETRTVEETNSIRRRRECLECQQRFTTYERVENISPLTIYSATESIPLVTALFASEGSIFAISRLR